LFVELLELGFGEFHGTGLLGRNYFGVCKNRIGPACAGLA